MGRLFTRLLFSSSELKQAELAREFAVTTATISRNLKTMEKWHLVARKGESGSREWLYKTTPGSFFDLFCGPLAEQYTTLQDRKETLLTLNDRWNDLASTSGQPLEWREFQRILGKLLSWVLIYEEELKEFLKDLKQRFEMLE